MEPGGAARPGARGHERVRELVAQDAHEAGRRASRGPSPGRGSCRRSRPPPSRVPASCRGSSVAVCSTTVTGRPGREAEAPLVLLPGRVEHAQDGEAERLVGGAVVADAESRARDGGRRMSPSASSFCRTRGCVGGLERQAVRLAGAGEVAALRPARRPSSSSERALPGSSPRAVRGGLAAREPRRRGRAGPRRAPAARAPSAGSRKSARRAKRRASARPRRRGARGCSRTSGSSSGVLPSAVSTRATSERATA